jgi:putative MFS transporter
MSSSARLDVSIIRVAAMRPTTVGALLFGWLAERYGRVPSVSVAVGVMSVMSIVCALSGNFLALRQTPSGGGRGRRNAFY